MEVYIYGMWCDIYMCTCVYDFKNSTLYHVYIYVNIRVHMYIDRCDTLQQTTTQCDTLQHTATLYNTLQHTATYCNALQRTPVHTEAVKKKIEKLADSQIVETKI